jgi:hypothetical protein
MRQRDMQYHTCADYLVWSVTSGNELIDGVAYVREPPSPSWLHQEIRGKPERAYVAPLDVRLPKNGGADDQIDTVVQPDVFIARDRTVAIYRLAAGQYSRPAVLELTGRTAITAIPRVSIDWVQVIAALTADLRG